MFQVKEVNEEAVPSPRSYDIVATLPPQPTQPNATEPQPVPPHMTTGGSRNAGAEAPEEAWVGLEAQATGWH